MSRLSFKTELQAGAKDTLVKLRLQRTVSNAYFVSWALCVSVNAYTDNSGELKSALFELKIPHDKSTPYRPQANGFAERAVRRVKEGTACALIQSGLSDAWWHYAKRFLGPRTGVARCLSGRAGVHREVSYTGTLATTSVYLSLRPANNGLHSVAKTCDN